MTVAPHRVIYIHNSSKVQGGNKVLLGLIERLNRDRFAPACILPGRGPMEQELAGRDAPVHIVPLDRAFASRSRTDALRCTLAFARVFLSVRPALMHANGVMSYRYASLSARVGNIRRVCHIHHPGEVFGSDWGFRVRPDVVITGSRFMYEEISAHLLQLPAPPRVTQITNAVDTDAFCPPRDRAQLRAEADLGRYSFLAVIVGSVTEHKGHRLFLQMARRLVDIEPKAGFLVVGEDMKNDGEYRREMQAYAATLGIAANVVFYGFASDELTQNLMAASDVFVLPTREEGFGLALAEAQACGIPVVSTAVGPIPQVVADGETGILVPEGNLAALTDAVVSLLKDPNRRQAMGAKGRERAVRLFGPDRYTREVEELYAETLLEGR